MAIIDSAGSSSQVASGSQSATSKSKLDADLNRFLNLLVTQLKNQDPLDPMKANEFTTQLVQFASVEQQIYQNANLEKLLALEQTKVVSSLVDFIGTTIESNGRKVPLEDANAEFTYSVPANANKVTVTITNESGLTVFKGDGETGIGKHTYVWDGRSTSGVLQPDGTYNVLVSGLDFGGNLLNIGHTVWGRVTGANVADGQASLFIGDGIVVPQDSVLSVKETKQPSGS
jgi:flagellar basal-body rod modification protein FlgD